MKTFLKGLGGLILVAVAAFFAFFFWASSGPLPDDAMATVSSDLRASSSAASAPSDTITVATYNIGYLSGMTNNEPIERSRGLYSDNMQKALDLLREADADVIGVQEIDFGAERSFGVEQADSIAAALGYPVVAKTVNWDERYLPFPGSLLDTDAHFGRVVSGQAILSRFPVQRHERLELARTSRSFITDALYLDRLAQVAVLDVGGWPLVVINVHFEAFEEATRETQARQVRALYDSFAAVDRLPVILLGDFNSVVPAEMPTLSPEQAAQFAEDETMPVLLDGTDLRPAFPDSAYASGENLGTYPADAPSRKIDHIFYREGTIAPVDAEVGCGGDVPPSDHCAVWMRMRLLRSGDAPTPPTEVTVPAPDAR